MDFVLLALRLDRPDHWLGINYDKGRGYGVHLYRLDSGVLHRVRTF
jgi:hypothetical protein